MIAAGLAAGGGWLPPPRWRRLLPSYGLPVAESRSGRLRATAAGAPELGGRVAVKAIGPGLLHKSEVGAVRLGLTAPAPSAPRARCVVADGGRVAPRLPRAAHGACGPRADRRRGRRSALRPAGRRRRRRHDRGADRRRAGPARPCRTARGGRDAARATHVPAPRRVPRRAPRDIGAVEDIVDRVAALAAAHPEIAELDCNPVVAGPDGAVIVDARVRLEPAPALPPLGAAEPLRSHRSAASRGEAALLLLKQGGTQSSGSALLQHRIPDALRDLDEVVAGACEPPVELALRGDLAQVVDVDERRHRRPVDVLEPALALDGLVGGFGRAGVAVAARAREGLGELPRARPRARRPSRRSPRPARCA